jgi:hypothetical protein
MQKRYFSLVAMLALFFSFSSQAALSPLGIAVVPPVQFPPSDFTVTGARLSLLWGLHKNVYGLDVGAIGNMTDGQMTGIAVSGLFNYNRGMTTAIGLQVAGLANVNVNKARVYGLQLALVNANRAESVVVGVQAGLANLAMYTNIRGVQVGVYNRAHDVVGFQIGLVNIADSLHGIQIGLINFHRQGLFSVAPILNVGF